MFEVAITDKPSVLQRKVDRYLGAGGHAVCYVYPDLRAIVIYSQNKWRELTVDDQLEFPELIPALSIPVAAVFEGL